MLIYYLAVQPEQRISDLTRNDGETVILMVPLFAMALLAVGMAFMALAVTLAFMAMAVHMAFLAKAIRLALWAVAIRGQDISLERFIRVAAILLPIKS